MSAAELLYPPNEPELTGKEFAAAWDFVQTGDWSELLGQRPTVVGRARELFINRWGQRTKNDVINRRTGVVFRQGTPQHVLDTAEKMGLTEDDLREGRT